MGRQKGKTYPGKKATPGNLAKVNTLIKRRAEKAAKELARKKMPEEKDRVAAPPGLPAGWICYRKNFHSGKFQAKVALRFASADGKHTDVSTLSQAIRKDAADKGADPKKALEALEQLQKAQVKEPDAQATSNLKKAVDAFRAKHGRLDTATVANLPGWTLATRETKNGQKLYVYKGPSGESARQVVQVEAALGVELLAGREVVGLETARAKGLTEKHKYKSEGKKPRRKGRRSGKKSKMSVDEPQKKSGDQKKGAVKKTKFHKK